MIHDDSITAVECADQSRGHFPMARGARQGCPASLTIPSSSFFLLSSFFFFFFFLLRALSCHFFLPCPSHSHPSATSSLATTSLHAFRQRRSRLRCRTSHRLFAAAAPAVLSAAAALLPLTLAVLWCTPCAVPQRFRRIPQACVRHRTVHCLQYALALRSPCACRTP